MHRRVTAIILALLLMAGVVSYSPITALAEGTGDDTVITDQIADANLLSVIRTTLGKAEDDDITVGDMLGLTVLTGSEMGIESLAGLEYAVNLDELYLNKNNISDLSPLAGLVNLTHLDLSNNSIRDISPLGNLRSWTTLELKYNRIANPLPLREMIQNHTSKYGLTLSLESNYLPNGSETASFINELTAALMSTRSNFTYSGQRSLSGTPFDVTAEATGMTGVELSWDYLLDTVYRIERTGGGKQ